MMKRFFSLSLLLCLLLSLLSMSAAGDAYAVYSDESNSGVRDVICSDLNGTGAAGYYTGNYAPSTLFAQEGDALLQSLRTLMTDTHKVQTSYSDCRDYAVKTDCQQEDGTVVLIYTGYAATRKQYINDTSKGWNREHIWPKSLGGFNQDGPGADLHHIRPSDSSVNGTRGNLKYGEVTDGKEIKGTVVTENALGGYSGGGYFEPLDNVKGDVARICLYLYARYGGEAKYTCSKITTVFQSVDVLLEWMALDPVDTWEMGRNEVVEAIQGNRNVFIDYPELAWKLFGQEVPADLVTPSVGTAVPPATEAPETPPAEDPLSPAPPVSPVIWVIAILAVAGAAVLLIIIVRKRKPKES